MWLISTELRVRSTLTQVSCDFRWKGVQGKFGLCGTCLFCLGEARGAYVIICSKQPTTCNPKEKLVLCHVIMDAPVTPVTSGKPRSRIRVQNFVAVEGLTEKTTLSKT